MLGCPMYDVECICHMTRCHIWSLGRLTNTFDIVHGTSQHLTLHEQQSNAPLPCPRSEYASCFIVVPAIATTRYPPGLRSRIISSFVISGRSISFAVAT